MSDPTPTGTDAADPGPPLELKESIRVGTVLPERLWDFAWSEPQLARWFGVAAAGPRGSAAVVLGLPGRLNRTGRLDVLNRGSVRIQLDPAAGWMGSPATTVVVEVEQSGTNGSRLTVREAGFATAEQTSLARVAWREALRWLRDDAQDAARREENPRQAVVIFHGMGNQQPGETLRGLIEGGSVDPHAKPDRVRIKPDRLSPGFETFRCHYDADTYLVRPRTDVYEAYWAHQVQDTKLGQVAAWAWLLLKAKHVPPTLAKSLWLIRGLLILVLLVAGVVGAVLAGWLSISWLEASIAALALTGGAGAAVVTLLRDQAVAAVTGILGDVPRYLRPLPENIDTRRRVRDVGVDLLRKLHDSGEYDRVVVIGHSLGSVVAYDVITQFWLQRHDKHERPNSPRFAPIRDVERAIPPTTTVDIEEAQNRQFAAWYQSRLNTQPWLITDFVTIGSPLAHAALLLRASPEQFEQAKVQRVLPTCPPVTEEEAKSHHHRISFERGYRTDTGRRRTFTLLHHAAPFAVTRWTNLYFTPTRLGLRGDPIGGPIAPVFGSWVRDVPLTTTANLVGAHTGYWSKGTTAGDVHLNELHKALKMNCGGLLIRLNAERSLHRPAK